jgi:O-acetylhomoserine (thiol)-lyase
MLIILTFIIRKNIMTKIYKNPETIGLHAGWRKDENTNSVAVPIHQTTSYEFDSTEHAANLFGPK